MPRTYTLPSFPVVANVWYAGGALPPGDPEDAQIHVSLAPLPFNVMAGPDFSVSPLWMPTHIMRTATNYLLQDGFSLIGLADVTLGSIIEVPADSGCFYRVTFASIVGYGYANMHSRAYVQRHANEDVAPPPPYVGYV